MAKSIDLRGAKLVGERKFYEPPTSIQMSFVKATRLINKTVETAEAWSVAFNRDIGPALVERGDQSVDVTVPEGGQEVLALLGFGTAYIGKSADAGDYVRVYLGDKSAMLRVVS